MTSKFTFNILKLAALLVTVITAIVLLEITGINLSQLDFSEIIHSLIFLTSALFWLIISSTIIGHLMQLCFQKQNISFNYDDIKKMVSIPSATGILLVATGVIIILYLANGYRPTLQLSNVFITSIAFIFLQIVIKYFYLDVNETYIFNLTHKLRLDYASNMADMFFHGYLKIILPRTSISTGIYFKMEQYEASQNVIIRLKKLFILIPKSGHIPGHNLETNDGWILSRRSLETLEIDRGGVVERPYKNSVYTIQDPKKEYAPMYVVLEGASPLKTLMEASDAPTPWSHQLREHRSEIIDNFYNALRMNIERDVECRHLIELVYYDDIIDQSNDQYNVGRLIYETYFMNQEN